MQHMFGLSIQSVTKCKVCSLESAKEDWQIVWTIPIFSCSSLIEALTEICSEEELDLDNLYRCSNCKKEVPSSRTSEIMQVSPIIFIHLRLFIYDASSNISHKIHQFITYPKILNLTPYFNKSIQESNKENDTSNNLIYQLYAVVVHRGATPDEGHIFTYIRSPDGFWYKANDESITRIKLDEVLTDKDAYILCYAKVPTGTMVSSDTELIIPPLQSPSLFTSSTPIRSSKTLNDITNKYTNVRKKFSLSYIYSTFMLYLDKSIGKYFCFS
jgi:ubiquitin C-terminal hydrolase